MIEFFLVVSLVSCGYLWVQVTGLTNRVDGLEESARNLRRQTKRLRDRLGS